jgi:deazaflavin-dependent oxidoreductase (nitroreductase family)
LSNRRQAYPSIREGVKAAGSLRRDDLERIFPPMILTDGSTFVGDLTTIGRKSGRPRNVELRFLFYQGNFYATSTRVQGKHWCQNMIKNNAVDVTVKGVKFNCTATQLTDAALRKQILTLRDSPPQLQRVVFEITPNK